MKRVEMQPYSVSKGKEYTNWWAELTILKELKEKGQENWTEEEQSYVENLQNQAEDWVTCACGNECAIIPRTYDGPDDYELNDLGCEFSSNIDDLDIEAAVSTLDAIENRSAELIKEIRKAEMLK